MPAPYHRPPALRPPLSLVQQFDPTNAEVLRAVDALAAKVDALAALLSPRPSPLTIDPDEIARTMAQLRMARPVKETPP